MIDLDSPRTIFIASALVVAGFFVAGMLLVSPKGMEFVESSENITGMPPALAEGDVLAYNVVALNDTFEVNITAEGRDAEGGCTVLSQRSDVAENITACFSERNGSVLYVAAGENVLPREAFTVMPVIHAFEPWMASVRQGWSGKMNASRVLTPGIIPLGGQEDSTVAYYSINGTENVSGRLAFRVESTVMKYRFSSEGETGTPLLVRTVWVDAEKKVMLKEVAYAEGINISYTILRAPFIGAGG